MLKSKAIRALHNNNRLFVRFMFSVFGHVQESNGNYLMTVRNICICFQHFARFLFYHQFFFSFRLLLLLFMIFIRIQWNFHQTVKHLF